MKKIKVEKEEDEYHSCYDTQFTCWFFFYMSAPHPLQHQSRLYNH